MSHPIAFICYGAKIKDSMIEKTPWWNEGENDFDEWWLYEVHEFKPDIENPFDERGQFKAGFESNDARVADWYEARQAHEEKVKRIDPCPVELIRWGHEDDDHYIIAVKGSVKGAGYNRTTKLNLTGMITSMFGTETGDALLNAFKFTSRYLDHMLIQTDGPGFDWLLSAWFG